MFRAIYKAATAVVKVSGVNGQTSYSDPFSIKRGVLQGDITSPVYFILALDSILRRHDKHPKKGIIFGGKVVHTLGHADDATLLDYSDEVASDRVTAIAQGSADDADMIINVAKTQCMHVKRQEVCPLVTEEEIKMRAKFVCPHINCNHVF